MKNLPRIGIVCLVLTCLILAEAGQVAAADQKSDAFLQKIGSRKGICVFLGLPAVGKQNAIIKLAQNSDLMIYVQCSEEKDVRSMREGAEASGLLGKKIWADHGFYSQIQIADNLADAVVVTEQAVKAAKRDEVLRVLRPEGKGLLGSEVLSKPFPEGVDDWSHPYHGPDNNPLSVDRLAVAPYRTQFIAYPKWTPMPEVTVAAAGRLFRAHGHISFYANQNHLLNTLMAINGYNGATLWKRSLRENFVVHRNAMIATRDRLYLGDNESCKLLDARTGELVDEIIVPEGVSDGPVWKWMGLEGGVLHALVGGPEVPVGVKRRNGSGLGGWWWGMWKGHDFKDPKTNLAFGRTIAAFDPATKKMLWHHREEDYIDGRAVCMKNGRIYYYSPHKFLGCLDARSGKVLWKMSDPELLAAIGKDGRAQSHAGFATETYIKCSDRQIFFAGPQRPNLVVVSAEDGRLMWQKEKGGHAMLVLREDGVYAVHKRTEKLAYDTGKTLARVRWGKTACARPTGTLDSIFCRAHGGTVRIDVAAGKTRHISLMRPPCQDGVIASNGMLYWGPWMCHCRISLHGHIGLVPAGNTDQQPVAGSRLHKGPAYDSFRNPQSEIRNSNDWPTFRGDNGRTSRTTIAIPASVDRAWSFKPPSPYLPTAPVAAGGLAFIGDASGTVRSLDAENGTLRWKAYTGGRIVFPPAIWNGRVYAGSDDGCVYAFEAASGRLLWRFRAAPADRKIPVYGKLTSTWPVAGGVVVEDGIVYAAAGIADYDSTHVYALDGVTGKVKWYNGDSGQLSEQMQTGISLQGILSCSDGELRFPGGNVYKTARYDLKTGTCLNTPHHKPMALTRTIFEAYYPFYTRYAPIRVVLSDGNIFRYSVRRESIRYKGPGLHKPLPPDAPKRAKPEMLWDKKWMCRSFIVGSDVFIAAGRSEFAPKDGYDLCAAKIGDGSKVWSQPLPARPVKWGTAMDGNGRIFVSLDDGSVLCFAPEE